MRQRYGSLIDVIVVEAAEDLSGFQLGTVVRCSVCGALTIRQRARSKQYCSSRCRWQAVTDERRAPCREVCVESQVRIRDGTGGKA